MRAFRLEDERYSPIPDSLVVPGIDLEELVSFLDRLTTSRAIREYREALRARG